MTVQYEFEVVAPGNVTMTRITDGKRSSPMPVPSVNLSNELKTVLGTDSVEKELEELLRIGKIVVDACSPNV